MSHTPLKLIFLLLTLASPFARADGAGVRISKTYTRVVPSAGTVYTHTQQIRAVLQNSNNYDVEIKIDYELTWFDLGEEKKIPLNVTVTLKANATIDEVLGDRVWVNKRSEATVAEFRVTSVKRINGGEMVEPTAPQEDAKPSNPAQERVDRKGLLEEPILDPVLLEQLERELSEAQAGWEKEEREKEVAFEHIRKEKITKWQEGMLGGRSGFDDHPDVVAMRALTGQKNVLIAPSVAKQYDNMLIDRGWYPYADKPDDEKHLRSFRDPFIPLKGEANSPGETKPDAVKHPDVPADIEIPSYDSIRDHYLRGRK